MWCYHLSSSSSKLINVSINTRVREREIVWVCEWVSEYQAKAKPILKPVQGAAALAVDLGFYLIDHHKQLPPDFRDAWRDGRVAAAFIYGTTKPPRK